jgi:hypothetical protein
VIEIGQVIPSAKTRRLGEISSGQRNIDSVQAMARCFNFSLRDCDIGEKGRAEANDDSVGFDKRGGEKRFDKLRGKRSGRMLVRCAEILEEIWGVLVWTTSCHLAIDMFVFVIW